ncbi:hypothetical protein ANN_23600 [Periplaneta americana]|uniref:Uncharacterized protein n=1 Tax=Periplaneta americana TaxID=6978 RepID=A0ABQ8SLK8_PERAM|nr:hypothetical protein ANN_23600 [Periplaneta americana]
MDLREVGYDDRDWINLAQDRDRWRAYIPRSNAEQFDGITVFRILPMASLMLHLCHQLAEVVAVSISRHQ